MDFKTLKDVCLKEDYKEEEFWVDLYNCFVSELECDLPWREFRGICSVLSLPFLTKNLFELTLLAEGIVSILRNFKQYHFKG